MDNPKTQSVTRSAHRLVRRVASALDQMCKECHGIGLSNATDEARIIIEVVNGKTYRQACKTVFPESPEEAPLVTEAELRLNFMAFARAFSKYLSRNE